MCPLLLSRTAIFFVLNKDRKVLARVNPDDGAIKWHARVPGSAPYEASPLVCDGKIYVASHSGLVVVFDAENGEQLFQKQMDEKGKTRCDTCLYRGFPRTTVYSHNE